MNGQRFWRIYARHYDTIWDSPVVDEARAVVHGLIGEPRTVVDLGCGTGLMSSGLVQRGARVIGIDTSQEMLDRAVVAGRVSTALLAPAEQVPLQSGVADAIIVGNLLHLHPDPIAVIAEARRLAGPGAPVIATWPVPGLTPRAVYHADRLSGRSLKASLRAHVLRGLVGVIGAQGGDSIATRARGERDSDSWQIPEVVSRQSTRCQVVVSLE